MTYNKHIFEGGFGLERETLRVNSRGRLAQTNHPFDNKYLERDFCENQLEIITPVCSSVQSAVDKLSELSDNAEKELNQNGEYLWLNSNPPHFDSIDEIAVAKYGDDKHYKFEYRKKLEERYGKKLMLYSGIHFNFSFSDDYIKSFCLNRDFEKEKNKLYFKLLKYATRYSWLIVLFTSASPVYDISLDDEKKVGSGFDGYASRRNGEKGYWNKFIPYLDYSSISAYTDSIKAYIKSGKLFSASELYFPVRLKPKGENSLDALINNGIDHIELRMFDLNPLAECGVFADDLKFAHYFCLYLLSLPDFDFTYSLQSKAIANHKAAAKFNINEIKIGEYSVKEVAEGLLDDMKIYFNCYNEVVEIIEKQRLKLSGNNRYSDRVLEKYNEDFQGEMTKLITEKRRKKQCASCLVQV